MNKDLIPDEIRHLKRWVGRKGKIPMGKCNDPSTWAYLDEVYGRYNGEVSFALSEEDNIVAIDLDNCFEEDKSLKPQTRAFATLLPSYTEVSMSGNGLHILGYADIPFSGRKTRGVEVYSSNRFIAMTGKVVKGREEVINIQEGLDKVIQAFFPPKSAITLKRRVPKNATMKQDILYVIRSSKQGPKFNKLMKGDCTGYDSQSNAEFALLSILYWWLGDDDAMVRQIFKSSLLKRDKWDRKDGVYGTYLDRTMAAAKALQNKEGTPKQVEGPQKGNTEHE